MEYENNVWVYFLGHSEERKPGVIILYRTLSFEKKEGGISFGLLDSLIFNYEQDTTTISTKTKQCFKHLLYSRLSHIEQYDRSDGSITGQWS